MRVDGRDPVNGASRRSTASSSRGSATPISQSPLHDVLGHDGTPGGDTLARDRARRDPALHGGGAAPHCPKSRCSRCRWASVFLARRRRRRRRAAHGRLSQGRLAHGHSRRRLSRRRHRRADLPRRRFPHRARGGAPEHHRRVRARDEDERGRVAALSRSSRTSRSRRARSPRCAST